MKRKLIVIFALFCSLQVYSQKKTVTVFESGKDGHKSYRIPAIIRLPDEKLLAFSEGRVHNAGDFGDINIVLKVSKDKGRSWSALKTVVDYDALQAGNPAPVVDLSDPQHPEGRIFLFYNTGNNHEGEVRKGHGLREVWYKTSVDGGETWSDPVNITMQVHRPKQPAINSNYNFKEDWRSYANTPGHAMQFSSGKYNGRIYVAANHSSGDPIKKFEDYKAHGFYSDDHGKSFQISEIVSIPGGNESMAAEMSGDRLMMNSRNQQGDTRARIVSISSDGGHSWDTSYFDQNLPDPVNQGSILTIGKKRGRNIIAFCNAADTKQRNNLTLRVSFNDGLNYTKNILVDKGPDGEKGDHTAYSDIVKLSRRKVGVLYEKAGYSRIVFKSVKW